jgi:hypothetical protein
MFGRRSGPTPARVRLIGGLVMLILGAVMLAVILNSSPGADTKPEAHWIGLIICGGVIAAGLLWTVGVFFGVGDYGDRPAAMPVLRRLLLDAFGYLFIMCLTGTFAFFAFSPGVQWGNGVGAVLARLMFGAVALIFGGSAIIAVTNAVRRALRGEPYDDKSPSPPQIR